MTLLEQRVWKTRALNAANVSRCVWRRAWNSSSAPTRLTCRKARCLKGQAAGACLVCSCTARTCAAAAPAPASHGSCGRARVAAATRGARPAWKRAAKCAGSHNDCCASPGRQERPKLQISASSARHCCCLCGGRVCSARGALRGARLAPPCGKAAAHRCDPAAFTAFGHVSRRSICHVTRFRRWRLA